MRSAWFATSAYRIAVGISSNSTHGCTITGTCGTSSGCISPMKPKVTRPATTAIWPRTIHVRPCGRLGGAITASAMITPPAGTARAPARPITALRPYSSRMKPGVLRPWIASMPAITVNARPTRPARMSLRRTATRVINTLIAAAASDEPATIRK